MHRRTRQHIVFSLSGGPLAAVVFALGAHSCQDYTCHDLANCPLEIEAASADASLPAIENLPRPSVGEATSPTSATEGASTGVASDGSVSGETTSNDAGNGELALGEACRGPIECASGFCADGVCCGAVCQGSCIACNLPGVEGDCVASETDLECDDAGAGPGKQELGESCQEDAQCDSGRCVISVSGERICCDDQCSGQCQGCGADGHCSVMPEDDDSCAEVSCGSSSECVTLPAELRSNRCQSFGTCWTVQSYCTPTYAEPDATCTVDDRDGRCDGAGTCVATIECGDAVTEGEEECDDANDSDIDGCTRQCKLPACGDGIVQANRGELCDDGNDVNGDGCSRNCVSGYAPKGSSMVTSVHLCGIRASGTPSCWGLNSSGELGRGSTSSSGLELPSAVLNENNVVDIAMNGGTTCAVRRTGQVSCWGGGFGALSVVLGGIADATQISAGDSMPFCARRANGEVGCWGTDGVVAAHAGLASVVQLVLGDNHRCALKTDESVVCLGSNAAGEGGRSGSLGGPRAEEPTAASLLEPAVQLAAGYRYTCYIPQSKDSVRCVGDRQTLGNPSAADGINPVTVLNVNNPEKLASGNQHVCVLERDGKVFCWGQGAAAASTMVSETPVEIELPSRAIDVGAGSQTSCALLEDGSTYCWGAWAPTTQSRTPVFIDL